MITNLEKLRKDKGLSQKELALVLNTTQQSIHKYEKDRTQPPIELLKKMADFFETSIDYLIGETEIQTKYENIEEKMLSRDEHCVMEEYRKLNCEEKNVIKQTLKAFSKSSD